MNKQELVNNIVEKSGLTKKDATLALESTLGAITGALSSGDSVKLQGFGNFEVRKRSARLGRNPQTNEPISIPASKSPAWKPSKKLKDSVNA